MNTKRGFTIIEMLVVISIITILPVVVVANFPAIKSQFALSRTAHRFAQDVRRVQDMAISAVTYTDSFGVTRTVSGYGIYINLVTPGNTQYIVYGDNNEQSPGDKRYNVGDYSVQTINFGASEPGIVIKEMINIDGTAASINFSPPNPDTTITPLSQAQSQIMVVFAIATDLSKTRTVLINSSGLI